jgi:hypothetical protein
MVDLTNADVETALDEIDTQGVPRKRISVRHCLVTRGRHYPPKHVLYRAHILKAGTKWPNLKGGKVANGRLISLGYTVEERCECGNQGVKIIP